MTQPTSRTTFKDYCKRKLGHPVVELNLDDDQIEDTIDDAITYWQEHHFDGTHPEFVKKQITASTQIVSSTSGTFSSGETIEGGSSGIKATFHQYHSANTTIRYSKPTTKNNSNADAIGDGNTYYTDITTTWTAGETITGASSGATATVHASTAQTIGDIDNQYLSLDESYIGITGIIPLTENLQGSTNMFSVNYQYALNDLYTMGAAGDMKNYVFTQQYLAAIQNLFVGLPRFRFNRHRDRIYLDIDWSADLKIDDFVVIEAYASMNPETYTDAYRQAYGSKGNQISVGVRGSNLAKSSKIAIKIQELQKEVTKLATQEAIMTITDRHELLTTIARSDSEKTRDRLAAVDLLAKAQGDYVTITESRNLNVNVDLSAYTEEELKTMLMYMEKDNSSIIDTK